MTAEIAETADGAARVRTPRAIAAAIVFVGFGAAAHWLGVGVPVQAIPLAVVVVLVAPMVWLILPSTVSPARALVAAIAAQVIMHVALLGMEPSSGGSATRANLHPEHAAIPLDDTVTAAGTALSVLLIQVHVAAAMLSCVFLVVAHETLRSVLRAGPHAPLAAPPS